MSWRAWAATLSAGFFFGWAMWILIPDHLIAGIIILIGGLTIGYAAQHLFSEYP